MDSTHAADQWLTPKSDYPGNDALDAAAKLIQAAASVEETRFNNLNSRGIAVLTGSSLVTSLAALFSKELLTGTLGTSKSIVAASLILSLVLLLTTAAVVVIKVLLPSRRATFGNNDVTDGPTALQSALDVQRVTYAEYRAIQAGLVKRNTGKAKALHLAYCLFLASILTIALSVVVVAARAL